MTLLPSNQISLPSSKEARYASPVYILLGAFFEKGLFFFATKNYNLFLFLFLHIKKSVLLPYLQNSFSTFHSSLLVYNFENNLFIRNRFLQQDYFMDDFLNTSLSEFI